MTLLSEVAEIENLYGAFSRTARGKKKSLGFQKLLLDLGESLLELKTEVESSTYSFGPYRKFHVHDPKARVVSAPPFRDRVIHTAICQIIEPYLDQLLSPSVYACRVGKGSRNAVIDLKQTLQVFGRDRFVIKLDIEKYFDSIDHSILFELLDSHLPDRSLSNLFTRLLSSHKSSKGEGKGLPIGSLTSQLFANFYLHEADQIIERALGAEGFYYRYMDDFVIGAHRKSEAFDVAGEVIAFVRDRLLVEIPHFKKVPLGNDPIPFLGFVLSEDSYRILSRNRHRYSKKIRRLEKANASDSAIYEVELSFNAWKDLDLQTTND